LEEACYHRAKRIVVTSRTILDRLKERNIPNWKLTLIRNGANTHLFRPTPQARQQVRSQLGISRCSFVALYAGLFGLAYELDLIVEVARILQASHPDIHFLLLGEGPTRSTIEDQVKQLSLPNITILSSKPRTAVPDYFSAADVSLVPLKAPNIPGMLPVKIYDSMACEVPLVVAATGEPRWLVEKHECGIVIDPGSAQQLHEAILHLKDHPELCRRYGNNGRQSVVKHYSRQAQADRLANLLVSLG
jgi:glycosyltransferase involved in cell wall biosynthesis